MISDIVLFHYLCNFLLVIMFILSYVSVFYRYEERCTGDFQDDPS